MMIGTWLACFSNTFPSLCVRKCCDIIFCQAIMMISGELGLISTDTVPMGHYCPTSCSIFDMSHNTIITIIHECCSVCHVCQMYYTLWPSGSFCLFDISHSLSARQCYFKHWTGKILVWHILSMSKMQSVVSLLMLRNIWHGMLSTGQFPLRRSPEYL